MFRFALSLALIVAATARAASIPLSDPGSNQYIQINPEFVNVTQPRGYEVRVLNNWDFTPKDGFQDLSLFNMNPSPPPFWKLGSFWILKTDNGFSYQPVFQGAHTNVDLTEFVTTGDDSLTLMVDGTINGTGPWNTITWISPHLGTVTRTYQLIPELNTADISAISICGSILLFTSYRTRKKT